MKIRKILYPTDFSPCARQALSHALLFAEQFDAELHMLYAVVLGGEGPVEAGRLFEEPEEISRRLGEIAASEMATLAAEHQAGKLEIRQAQERGLHAAPVILDYAQEHGIDLIVMGTHGRRGLSRFLLGSVAAEVVRFAPCPVVTLRELEEPRRVEAIESILVPVDFSPPSERALGQAVELARSYGARLDVLHVVEEPLYPEIYGTPSEIAGLASSGEERVARAEGALEQLANRLIPGSTTASPFVLRGRPAPEILAFARERRSDLVVISTRGLSGMERFFFGSTAEAVIRGADCPVFVAR